MRRTHDESERTAGGIGVREKSGLSPDSDRSIARARKADAHRGRGTGGARGLLCESAARSRGSSVATALLSPMTTPRLPEGIENELSLVHYEVCQCTPDGTMAGAKCVDVRRVLRREIAAALEERTAEQHEAECENCQGNRRGCYRSQQMRASAAAIRAGRIEE